MMELPFVLSVYHFWKGFQPIFEFGTFVAIFTAWMSCLFAALIKWLKNYPIAQLRPGLASNVNFAHRTLDNGQWTGPRHITDMDSSDTGRRILSQIRAYLACFHHQYGPYGDGFRDGQKRQTGTGVGMHNSQLATTDQLEIFWKYQIWKGVKHWWNTILSPCGRLIG